MNKIWKDKNKNDESFTFLSLFAKKRLNFKVLKEKIFERLHFCFTFFQKVNKILKIINILMKNYLIYCEIDSKML